METKTKPEEEIKEPQAQSAAAVEEDTGANFFALDDESRKKDFNDFVGRMKDEREPMEDAPFQFNTEEDPTEEAITDDDENNLKYFNYESEHKATALFAIGALDSGMGFMGMLATNLDPERYMAFANRTPPDYYVDAAAAMIKKYQAKLSVEAMLLTAIAMVYAPSVNMMMRDRKELKAREKQAAKEQEAKAMAEAIKTAQNG